MQWRLMNAQDFERQWLLVNGSQVAMVVHAHELEREFRGWVGNFQCGR